jgi:hypothetical protein
MALSAHRNAEQPFSLNTIFADAFGCRLRGGLLTAVLLQAGLPINESFLAYLLERKLLELSNADSPCVGPIGVA